MEAQGNLLQSKCLRQSPSREAREGVLSAFLTVEIMGQGLLSTVPPSPSATDSSSGLCFINSSPEGSRIGKAEGNSQEPSPLYSLPLTSVSFLWLLYRMTTNVMTYNTNLPSYSLSSEVWNGSRWAKIKALAGPFLGSWPFHLQSQHFADGSIFPNLHHSDSDPLASLFLSQGRLWLRWAHLDNPAYSPCCKVSWVATLIPSETLILFLNYHLI